METDRKSLMWLVAGLAVLALALALALLGGDDDVDDPDPTTPDAVELTTEPGPGQAPAPDAPATEDETSPATAAAPDAPQPTGAAAPAGPDRVPITNPDDVILPPGAVGPTTQPSPRPTAAVPEEFEGFGRVPSDKTDPRWVAAEYVRHARSLYWDRSPVWWVEEAEFITDEHRAELQGMVGSGYDEWGEQVTSVRMTSRPEDLETVTVQESDEETVVAVRWRSLVARDDQADAKADPQVTHVRLELVDGEWLADGELGGH